MTRFAELIRGWLGWCPHAPQRNEWRMTAAQEEGWEIPEGGAGPILSFGWKNRYLTQTLIFALTMTVVGIALFATATGDRIAMLGIGLVIATLLYVSDAVQYWKTFETVARTGTAPEFDWKQITAVKILPVIGVALIFAFVGAVLLGLLPGMSMLMANGLLAGFAAIGWYHFLTVAVWERKTGIILFTRGTQIYRKV